MSIDIDELRRLEAAATKGPWRAAADADENDLYVPVGRVYSPHDATNGEVRDNAAARLEHERNLDGKTLAKCAACNGRRYSEPGYQDYDGYGPIYREPVVCRACGGRGQVEVPCAPEVEAAAIKVEMAGLRRRLRELERSGG